ncbi:MAG: hypothetical protein V1718_05705 [archaeon]
MTLQIETTDDCCWLHNALEALPIIQYPFDKNNLPTNGIYFFFENGELWGHESNKPRIVRVGSHNDGNFRNRINDHFLLDESKMNFNHMKPKPSDRSVFRKHIGRALLNKEKDTYLNIWNKDFTYKEERESYGNLRDIEKEKKIESQITKILRQEFSFRFIIINDQTERIGDKGLEKYLIGTLSHCESCKASVQWLGNFTPERQNKIKSTGLWNIHHINSEGINNKHKESISNAIKSTVEWIKNKK